MKTSIFKKMLLLAFLTTSISINAQVWTPISPNKTQTKPKEFRKTNPTKFQLFDLNTQQLKSILESTPSRTQQKSSNIIIELPTEKGILKKFKILEASVLADELAKKFPDIKSYVGYGIDDPTSTARFSISNIGLHAMISSGNHGTIYIDPFTKDKQSYISYSKADLPADPNSFECLVEESVKSNISEQGSTSVRNANDGKLRTFRLAIACTGEYSQFHLNNQGISSGASDQVKKAAVLSAVNTTMTRVNGIFEKDLALTMVLVNNNTDIIFLNANTDNLSNNNAGALINESQTVCDNFIGFNNYDIGHAFSTGGGGLAQLRSPCTSSKARGITGSGSPIGDSYDVDYVAHEMGHQYGGNHTQNNSCQRSNASVEPGSASTIMGYAGICSPNVQNNSDAYFHAISIQEMWQNISQGSGTCGSQSNTNNAAPTADAGPNYTVPASTPFVLKGNGSDTNSGDSLTYCWEQMDAQPATMPPSATSTNGPAFRSLTPTASSDRYMPALSTVIGGQTSSTWEVVPSVSRTMNFRLTVRDNAPGGGGSASDNTQISVAGNAGPFVVNVPNTNVSWPSGSSQTVTWDVAGTTGNGINAANVDILLSTNGGNTYPVTIATGVANDGSHTITVPNQVGSQNRIMVRGSGNIFYDISNTNFEITQGSGDTQAPTAPSALAASNITSNSVDLNWNASTDNVGVTGYDVYRDNTVITTVTTTSYQVTGLTASTAYDFSIKAKDAAGNESTASNTVNVTTLSQTDTQAPTAPTALAASNITSNSVDLNWNASTDNVGVTGYDVYRDNTVITTVATTSYQATGLTANTAYDFSVKAKDAAGNESAASNIVTITTQTSGGNCTGGISSYPYTEGFENTLGAWSQGSGDDFDWSVDANGTPSRNTGPSSASEGTYYVYMESSSPNYPSKRAILNSPCFDLSTLTSANITFKYHMYGASTMGSLTLEASTDNGTNWTSIWSKSGNQGNSWQSATIDLIAYIGSSVQLRFNGITGNTWRGDMAIDDISVSDGGGSTTCKDIQLAITFDNYPEETSWQITDSNNQVVASGGTYPSQPDGSSITLTECLDPGTYTLTFNDSYGDGICCNYGQGSYTLTLEGNTLASGGSFGTTESTTFTIGSSVRSSTIDNVVTTEQPQISAFPNPVGKDRTLNVIVSKENSQYEVVDMLGRTVLKGEVSEKAINTSSLPSGMYILKLSIGNKGKYKSMQFIQE
ncbi:reprolysin-like metallopeptidase [Aquimarina sp. 2201CG5-10]|uniref:reprolysin-like metallopeptidase n=1 Tax=Aquimarina callyspongiae TaxID=3098150 RepID=UPI002AB563D4|nr:zinc-dependent metalloprotease family protein [Aquimarina sp. 2201CG5-10]MDY8136413.1 M12 family metallo-peptidase [Aquimarina sp. 2201CG5-10]